MKKWGWALLIVGCLLIIAGILAKRVFQMEQYLLVFHIVGGLCLVAGAMMAVGGKAVK
ncbi:MAG TPA: hypothetical protein VGQ81_03335 [Acidobacteriota bacterium]|jgi:uncharacterized membrane protein HdeD (DUF308 family)|nr:hypothetical protein [Acidobacteriota bacterium]